MLGLIIGAYLFEKYPTKDEGFLSQLRARVVNREFFNSIGRKMRLDEWMDRVAPHSADVTHSPAILGNAFEALVGAIFLDKGYKAVQKFFNKIILAYHLNIEEIKVSDNNYKSRLLEWSQKNGRKAEFRMLEALREGGQLTFHMEAVVDDEVMGSGKASQKKKAEQVAARQALDKLGLLRRSDY